MTTEGVAASQELPAADDGRLFCYRHPGRETWISCGRCEQPICTSCAMQGPVGFRCRTCGLDIALFQLPYLAEWEAEGVALGSWLPQFLAWGVIDGLAACAGAYYRTR